MLFRSDRSIETVLDALEASGEADHTIVIFTADHGDLVGSHGLRQKGNTVFETNPTIDGIDTPPVWGLAYKFRPLVLTASAEFTHFDPFNILLSAEYVSEYFTDAANQHTYPGHFIAHLRGSWRFSDTLEAFAIVRNMSGPLHWLNSATA